MDIEIIFVEVYNARIGIRGDIEAHDETDTSDEETKKPFGGGFKVRVRG